MNCPNCNSGNIRVLWSRGDTKESNMRERVCNECTYRWCTLEVIIPRNSFYRTRITSGASNWRPVRHQGFTKVTFS
jgi:transcriptional regulator NrdR family protein